MLHSFSNNRGKRACALLYICWKVRESSWVSGSSASATMTCIDKPGKKLLKRFMALQTSPALGVSDASRAQKWRTVHQVGRNHSL